MKQVPEVYVAGAREVVPAPEQMRERCIALDRAVCRLIGERGLVTDGVSLALYHGVSEAGIDVEMAYVVQAPRQASSGEGAATVHQLPAAQVAYAVYRGSYDDFGAVGRLHAAICQWIEERGYRIAGPSREYYLRPPQSDTARTGVMEIQYPVTPAESSPK
jgi:effector-binding domain-containing protein